MFVKKIESIKELIDKYQFFVIDIWGVLHDGDTKAFDFAIESLRFLKDNGKNSMILSNSPRNVDDIQINLKDKGIDREMYDFLFSSGQEVQNLLTERNHPFFKSLGNKAFILGYSNLHIKAGDLEVDDLDLADYLLVTRVPSNNLEASKPLLNRALEKKIPLVCANPDKVAQTFDGPSLCPGVIYDYYKKNKGLAISIGKPAQEVYSRLWSLSQERFFNFDKSKTLVIGDGLFTDILGANNQDLDSLLITSGIHSEMLKSLPNEELIKVDEFFNLTQQKEILPSYVCERFS